MNLLTCSVRYQCTVTQKDTVCLNCTNMSPGSRFCPPRHFCEALPCILFQQPSRRGYGSEFVAFCAIEHINRRHGCCWLWNNNLRKSCAQLQGLLMYDCTFTYAGVQFYKFAFQKCVFRTNLTVCAKLTNLAVLGFCFWDICASVSFPERAIASKLNPFHRLQRSSRSWIGSF